MKTIRLIYLFIFLGLLAFSHNGFSQETCEATASQITFEDGSTELSFCAGNPALLSIGVNVVTPGFPEELNVISTNANGDILGLFVDNPSDATGSFAGTFTLQAIHTTETDLLDNIEFGTNISELEGCFALSNPLTFTIEAPGEGGCPEIKINELLPVSGDGEEQLSIIELTGAPNTDFVANLMTIETRNLADTS
ncbi:MAG: hypothetical protein KTR13_07840, partial [Saprospiraceae bacterium]|nr:hypothetical protein [Saprospiraceae bacterium]